MSPEIIAAIIGAIAVVLAPIILHKYKTARTEFDTKLVNQVGSTETLPADGVISDDKLIQLGIEICKAIKRVLERPIGQEQRITVLEKSPGNEVKVIDLECNTAARHVIDNWSSGQDVDVLLVGEDIESNVHSQRSPAQIVCLLDSLDGTQHWLRGRNLYCTALSLFQLNPSNTSEYNLRVSVVHLASGDILYAREDVRSTYIYGKVSPLCPSQLGATEIAKAHVCTVTRRPHHYSRLAPYIIDGSPFAGLYSFGGNPILAELSLGNYDAVFYPPILSEEESIPLWDWLPGGHLVYRAGCSLISPNGMELDLLSIAQESINKGSIDTPYIAAIRSEIANGIANWIGSAGQIMKGI